MTLLARSLNVHGQHPRRITSKFHLVPPVHPRILTSGLAQVGQFTHFLQGDFAKVFETYTGALYYLDAAAWAALGAHDRAATLLRPRLSKPELGPVMSVLMASLLAILDGRSEQALHLIRNAEAFREREILFYLARHLGMLNAKHLAIEFLQRARREGFWSSTAMENDPAFVQLRNSREFDFELQETRSMESAAFQAFHSSLGSAVAWGSPEPNVDCQQYGRNS